MSHKVNEAADRALVIFVRYPRPGRVKTRLACTLGVEYATQFYRSCAEWIFHESSCTFSSIYIFYADHAQAEEIEQWAGPNFSYMAQTQGDLGKRMSHAFDYVFIAGHKKAILIGTDIPSLKAEILMQAFQLLDEADVVLGPAFDGGYYLIGLRKLRSELFIDINWSTPLVLRQTLEIAAHLKLQVSYLPELRDIDTEEDLRYWMTTSSVPKHFQPLREAIHHDISPQN